MSDDSAVYSASSRAVRRRAGAVARGRDIAAHDPRRLLSGAHTLSHFGDRVYPEMGNGGYTSVHTDVFINYDAIDEPVPAGHARRSPAALDAVPERLQPRLRADERRTRRDGPGPDMTVSSVTVNGQPATFKFVQPTYPGDPNGQDDPDPLAHAVLEREPGQRDQPEPAGLRAAGQATARRTGAVPGEQARDHAARRRSRAGRLQGDGQLHGPPGRAPDGDGSTEGWFRNATAGSEGAMVTTEPVGNDPGCR